MFMYFVRDVMLQGLSVRAIATVSPSILHGLGGIEDNAAGARLIKVCLEIVNIDHRDHEANITNLQECERQVTQEQVRL